MGDHLLLAVTIGHVFPANGVLSGFLNAVIFLANFAGGLVVGVAIIRGIIEYLRELFQYRGADIPKERIRLSLGRGLALALEFQLAADVLSTALNPSLRDIGVLAAIVVLRTLLNFFLQRELRQEERIEAQRSATGEAA